MSAIAGLWLPDCAPLHAADPLTEGFVTPPSDARPETWFQLIGGKVCDLATVRLNSHDLGTVWTAPWHVDISSAAKVGKNSLEITVINPWNNRLVGDAKLPIEQRRTSLSLQTVKADAPLQSAGLLGPVTVQAGAGEK